MSEKASSLYPPPLRDADLLLRETNHRCSNDLQLVVGLLRLQSRRAAGEETRAALNDAAERISVLARARVEVMQQRTPDLQGALRQVCDALQLHAEPRSVLISLEIGPAPIGLSAEQVTKVALVVNELMTNAIKHAFREDTSGRISVTVGRTPTGDVLVTVDDDGLPYPPVPRANATGLGLGLVRRLMASIDGLLIAPSGSSKKFELRVPIRVGHVAA